MTKGIQLEAFAHAARSLAHVTQQKWGAKSCPDHPLCSRSNVLSVS